MRKLFPIIFFILSACGNLPVTEVNESDIENATPLATRTAKTVPTATVAYASTLEVVRTQIAEAQATSNEASRLNTQATAEYEQRVQEQLQMTVTKEAQNFIVSGWTATAAYTSIPLTATAQVNNATAVSEYNAMQSAYMTATEHAPTQIVAMANAQYAGATAVSSIIGLCTLSLFMVVTGSVLCWYWIKQEEHAGAIAKAQAYEQSPSGVAEKHGLRPIVQIEAEPKIIVPVKPIARPVTINAIKYSVPCSKEQLTEFAEKIVTGEKTLAINQWEGSETLFTRKVINNMRAWLYVNKFVEFTENNEMVLLQEGKAWLEKWLEKNQLPTEYCFGVMSAVENNNVIGGLV